MSSNGDFWCCRQTTTLLGWWPNGDMPGGFMRVRTPADFAAVVRDRRLKLGWKQVELARKVGAGRQWIVDLERGKPGARLALVLRTLDALGITLTVGPAAGAC